MKNYLVITLGTREIQLLVNKIEEYNFEVIEEKQDKYSKYFIQKIDDLSIRIGVKPPSDEFPDFYTISPRTTGKVIDDNYDIFRPIIDFPIVRPALEYLKQKEVILDVIMLVYTDQEEAFKSGKVKFQNKENDSLFYADIISKLIKEDNFFEKTEIDQFAIVKNVTDLGFQYDDFKRINDSLLYPEEVRQVFLYPQGGIDQINQALILRLIETFKGKVKQLQKAEGADFIELDFPAKFLGSLNKQKIIKHLADYDFGAIDKGLVTNKEVYHLAQYASKRLNLQYDLIETNIRALPNHQLEANIQDDFEKLKDIYLAAKINYQQQRYTEFLWRTYTLNESLFKIEIKKLVGNDVDNFTKITTENKAKLTSWENALNRIDLSLISEITTSKMQNGYSVDTKNPNRVAFKILFNALVKLNCLNFSEDAVVLYNRIGDKLEALSSERNGIAHKLGSTSIAQINAILNAKEQGYTSKNLLSDLDQIFNIQGFGIYDKIKEEIEALL